MLCKRAASTPPERTRQHRVTIDTATRVVTTATVVGSTATTSAVDGYVEQQRHLADTHARLGERHDRRATLLHSYRAIE